MMKKIYIKLFCCALLLAVNASRTDHQASSLPELRTVTYVANCKALFTFKLQIVSVGTAKITEYGIVYSATNPVNNMPSVATDTKVIFDMPFEAGDKTKLAGGPCFPNVYYRAYAITDDGTVVYGDVIHFQQI